MKVRVSWIEEILKFEAEVGQLDMVGEGKCERASMLSAVLYEAPLGRQFSNLAHANLHADGRRLSILPGFDKGDMTPAAPRHGHRGVGGGR